MSRKVLKGIRVAITRPRDRAELFAASLLHHGAEVVFYPTLRIQKVSSQSLPIPDILLFTSATGVEFYFQRMKRLRKSVDTLSQTKIGVVGPGTGNAVRKWGGEVTYQPRSYTSEHLARQVGPHAQGLRVVHAGADKTNPAVRRIMEEHGARFRKLLLYRISRPKATSWPGADLVTFASAQSARNFSFMVKERPRAACIGPVTTRAARECGFCVPIGARPYTMDGLLKGILRWAN